MAYADALAWLYAQTRGGGRRHPGRAAALLELLGVQRPANLVRVVGTNGKGTVSAMLAAGLSSEGRITGRFLSPHVERFAERIAVCARGDHGPGVGQPEIDVAEVRPERVVAFVDEARAALLRRPPPEDLRPAFFELTLALALTVFGEAGASHAVLEAGVGGRDDATSAAVATDGSGGTNLRLVVLTNVDLDHTETLGHTLEAIAGEKAGAFARGVPAVTGASGTALETVRRAAAAAGATLHVDDGRDPLFALPTGVGKGGGWERQVANPSARAAGRRPRSGSTRLANARLAAAGLRLLGAAEGSVAAAVTTPPLPGRGERFTVDGREVVLDGAHDPAAAARLRAETGGDYVLLFGSLARKQGAATLGELASEAAAVVITAAEPGDDLERFAGPGRDVVDDPEAALELALSLTPRGGVLLIAGSLYLAGKLRPLLHSRTA